MINITVRVKYLWLPILLFSGVCFGHNGEMDDTHGFDDAYLAEQARLKESGASYWIDHWQEEFSHKLTQLTVTMLPDLVKPATAATGNPGLEGQWGAVTTWPFAFASASNLPDGRILAWGGNNRFSFNGGNFTYASIWNPANNAFTDVNHTTHSLFCGVPVMMEDGRVFVPGGDKSSPSSVKATSTFSTASGWTRIQDMAVGRWYDGTVYLPNGQVFAALGDPGSQYPEIWTPGSGWSFMNGASLQSAVLNYPTVTEPKNWLPHLHLAPSGQVFHSGHTPQMDFIDMDGEGNVVPVAINNDWNTANSPSVLYDEGKILQAGGILYGTTDQGVSNAAIIDLNSATPTRTLINSMAYARVFHNQVALPNGEVMVIGGNTTGLKFNDVGSQLTPEIWNPVSQTWRQVASHTIPRNYHSVALLMTDGRVWSGGGGLCACSADHPNSQVYSPPYLFNADGTPATRPSINAIQSTTVSFGQDINITTSPDVTKFSMVRMSSTTHALNSDMRFLKVPFTGTNGSYKLSLPTNRNIMVPGYWMLFALNAQGVPSVSKVIRVSTTNSPVIENIDTQTNIVGNALTFQVAASDPNPGDTLTYSATGLPTGLKINSTNGLIDGKPITVGNFLVVVSVTDGVNEVSVKFTWRIVSPTTPLVSEVFGGSTGTPFTDSVAANQNLTSVNVSTGWVVDSIQAITNTGPLPKHGGSGGTIKTATLLPGEYLVRIFGITGPTTVGKISLVTNTGRTFGPYATATNIGTPSNFDYTVPDGFNIVGFTGKASTSLNSIGVVYRALQDLNQPPVVTDIPDQVDAKGFPVSLQVTATDPEGDALTFSATGLPAGLTISPASGLISGTPTATGSYNNAIVTVKDSKGATSAVSFAWTINVPTLIVDQPTTVPKLVNTSITYTANIVNATNPRFKWSFGDGSAETVYSSSPISPAHAFTAPNLFVVKLTVTDDTGAVTVKTFTQAIYNTPTAAKPSASSNIVVSKNGAQLWVVNQDNNSVSVFDTAKAITSPSTAKLGEVTVGDAPRSIAQAPDGSFWVTNKRSNTLSVISSTTLTVTKTIALPFGSQPFGIAFSPDGTAAYVALEASGKLQKLSLAGVLGTSADVGAHPRHISITADSTKVLVSRYITKPMTGENTASITTPATSGGEVVVVATATMAVSNTVILRHSDLQDNTIAGSGIPNYLNVAAISPDGSRAWVPSKQDNIKRGTLRNGNNINFQNTVRGISSKINLVTMAEEPSERVDYDNTGIGTAAIYDKSGNYLFVALEATREVAIVDAYNGIVQGRVSVGRAPDGLALSSDGNSLYVSNFMDRTVSVIDATKVFTTGDAKPPVVAQLSSVGSEALTATVLKGKQFFYDAQDLRLARDGYLSCAVCHNDGEDDGRVWDLTGMGEGLRNTISLRGHGGMSQGLLHWSGNFDEVQDFEGQIRNLADGNGLLTDAQFTSTSDPLGTPKAGLSADLDALAAYLGSLNNFGKSPYRANGALTAAAVAGKAVFTSAGCAQCHGGEAFTDSTAGLSHDVGTLKSTSGKRLGGALTALDTPTLRDVWNTGPYLHDGSAPTLETAISAHTAVPSISSLTSAQISQIATYVQQIDGSEPGPDNIPPSVAMTSPANGASFFTSAGINLTANASDSDGTIAKVEYYAGTTLLGTVSSGSPFTYVWRGMAAGSYAITAKAYDNTGAVATSSPAVNITVQNDTGAVGAGLTGQYFNNKTLTGTPVLVRQEAVNFAFGLASPGPGVNVDGFSVRWSGQFLAPATGAYQFQVSTDDGVRLRVNGALVIDNWVNQGVTAKETGVITLQAGQKYDITMDYFDNSGYAAAKLYWKTPGKTTYVIIPATSLYAN